MVIPCAELIGFNPYYNQIQREILQLAKAGSFSLVPQINNDVFMELVLKLQDVNLESYVPESETNFVAKYGARKGGSVKSLIILSR
jgi:hypothetical protein